MVTEEKIRDRCPKCGSEDIGTAVRNTTLKLYVGSTLTDLTIVDIGWRCKRCGHEWGFEQDSDRKDR